MAKIIDGNALADRILKDLQPEVASLKSKGITPGLAIVQVGEHPASQIYIEKKQAACQKLGIKNFDYPLPRTTSEAELIQLIDTLNNDKSVHGILIQLPLPKGVSPNNVIEAVSPKKDVDGFHPQNLGHLFSGRPTIVPCTPAGILELIRSTGIQITGKTAVVLGRSNIVGKPIAALLQQENATVTVCHSKTKNVPDIVKTADIVVAAIGKVKFVKGSWIKKGAVVIDVGISRSNDGKVVGDVDFEGASKVAGFITPVPGGVGPMTIATLMKSVINIAKETNEKNASLSRAR